MSGKVDKTETAPGVIEPDTLYTLSELKRRTRLGEWAIRRARKRGLRVLKIGNARFIRGSEFIEFVEAAGTFDH